MCVLLLKGVLLAKKEGERVEKRPNSQPFANKGGYLSQKRRRGKSFLLSKQATGTGMNKYKVSIMRKIWHDGREKLCIHQVLFSPQGKRSAYFSSMTFSKLSKKA